MLICQKDLELHVKLQMTGYLKGLKQKSWWINFPPFFFFFFFLSINFHHFVPMDTNILLSCGGKTVIAPRIAASSGCKPMPQKTKTLIQLYPNFSMSEISSVCPVLRPVLRLLKTTQSATSWVWWSFAVCYVREIGVAADIPIWWKSSEPYFGLNIYM